MHFPSELYCTCTQAKNHYIAKRVGKNSQSDGNNEELVLFYKITQGQCPEYLTVLMPPLVSESTYYNLRSSQKYTTPLSHPTLYQKSLTIHNALSVHIFKRKLKQKYIQFPRPSTHHFTCNRNLNILHAILCHKCSSSRTFRSNLIENAICSCGISPETAKHHFFLLHKICHCKN